MFKKPLEKTTAYNETEISTQIFAAAKSVGGNDSRLAKTLSEKVISYLTKLYPHKTLKLNGEIEDAIEKILIEEGHAQTAKAFILKRKTLADLKKQKEMLGVKDELNLPLNSLIIIKNKYLRKNDKGEIVESTKNWLERVAKALSDAEEKDRDRKIWMKKFYEIMERMEFLPGGRTLANAGTINGQLANCFVLPVEDNIEELFEAVKESSILKKNGGGVGFSFSKIRPKGDRIATTTGAACGPVAIMKILDSASEILLQAGGRRSGNMVVLSVTHPDIFEFITCKEKDNALNQINFSLGITDKFMKAVLKNKEWELVNPRTGRCVQKVSARSIFEFASQNAWRNGDPGIIFLDAINRENPTPHIGPIEAVNLCGEQPLLSYEACNLGSINLVKFLKLSLSRRHSGDPALAGDSRIEMKNNAIEDFDWNHLEEVVRIAVRLLDNVITVCRYPLAKVDRVVKANRKIGLGVMGWADCLIKMGIAYNSDKALKLAGKVMKFINDVSHDESQKLGKLKGSFSNFNGSLWQKRGKKYMRNATTTTIAPTGSISATAGVSSGIEPNFALVFYKQVLGGVRLPEINADLTSALKQLNNFDNFNYDDILSEITKTGSLKNVKDIPEKLKKVFVTAMDLSYEDHVKMQAAFQKYTDNAVSKTINLPNTASSRDVENTFMMAWKKGCKGTTVYRDKSRDLQVLNVGQSDEVKMTNELQQASKLANFDPVKCPECGGKLVKEEGCVNCLSCGFSACSV